MQPPPQVLALMKKKGKLNLPLPQQNFNNMKLSFREFGKGNLEIVEPGELVSSERLKIVKNNLKRNLTSSSSKFLDFNEPNKENNNYLTLSTNFKNTPFNLSSNKKKQSCDYKEINKKLYPIFEKKDEGLFFKKKYFNIWGKNTRNTKRRGINVNILPEIKRTSNNPVIFLTKSIQDGDDLNINNEEVKNTGDNNYENNKKEMNIENNNNTIRFENNRKTNEFKNINNINKKEEDNSGKKSSSKSLKNEEEEKEEEEEIEEENEKDIKNRSIENKNKKEIKEQPIKIEINSEEKDNSINEIENDLYYNNNINNIKEKDINEIRKENEKRENDLRNLYKATKKINNAYISTFNLIKNSPLNNSNYDFISNEYIKLLDDHNIKIKAYQLLLLYKTFTENSDYYKKRKSFIEWKKNTKIFKKLCNKHLRSYDDHCISCSCEQDNLLKGQTICFNCNCNEIGEKLKNILIRYQYLKELNPIKYYLYLWHKNVFS